tara:strand:+ start:374 stop:682 length:309 start_codon:yes stop_codon:yes gene_type:complete
MAEIVSISITHASKKILEEFKKARPEGTSLSKAIVILLEDYLRNSSNPILKASVSNKLTLDSSIDDWKKLINEVEVEDFVKIQKKHSQVGNLINKRISKCLT